MTPKRYGIYYADLNPAIGAGIKKIRPVVIVSQDAMNLHLDTVAVCPLTRKLHPKWRSRIKIKCSGQAAEIAVDQIKTISKKRFKQEDKNENKSKRNNSTHCYFFSVFPNSLQWGG